MSSVHCWFKVHVCGQCNYSERSCPVLLGVEREGAVLGGATGVWISSIIPRRQRWCLQAAARCRGLSEKRLMEPYGVNLNAPWEQCGDSFTGMSFQPPDWSGARPGMGAAFALMLSILVSTGTTTGSPLQLEPQVRGVDQQTPVLPFAFLDIDI